MKDEQVQSALEKWFEDTDPQPPDARQTAAQVMAHVPETRQRGRWLPFPLFRRRVQTPTATDAIEYQSSPTPATDGHTPIVIGRTKTMFSPVKAITAGALVFAIGGALFIAQPVDQPNPAPAAETDAEMAPPEEFTGTWSFGANLLPETLEVVGRAARSTGAAWHHSATDISDSRFDGEVTIFANSDRYLQDGMVVWNGVWRVENDEGAWQSEPTVGIDFPDGSGTTRTAVFHGEGAYDGLSAAVALTLDGQRWDLHGVILDGDLPPDPDPTSLE